MAGPKVVVHVCTILLCFVGLTNQQALINQERDEFDFDGLPGSQHEFKIDVLPNREECFYQFIKRTAQLHMSFEVLRGSDRNVDVVVKGPTGRVIDKHLWTSEGTTDRQIEHEGVYAFCIGNYSRFSAKLVYFYFVTYILEEWEKFSQDIQDFDFSVENVTSSLMHVDGKVLEMKKTQAISRQHAITDWYIISGNLAYIQNWSLLMIIVTMATSGVQVMFVRRLFNSPNVTPTSKPRA